MAVFRSFYRIFKTMLCALVLCFVVNNAFADYEFVHFYSDGVEVSRARYTEGVSEAIQITPTTPTRPNNMSTTASLVGWCYGYDDQLIGGTAVDNGMGNCTAGNTVTIPAGTTGPQYFYALWQDPKFTLTTKPTGSFSFWIGAKGQFHVDCGTGGTFDSTTSQYGYISRANTSQTQYTCNYDNSSIAHTIKLGGLATGYNGYVGSAATRAAISFASDWASNSSANAAKIDSISGSLGDIFPIISGSSSPAFTSTFAGATNLTSIPATLFGSQLTAVANFANMFQQSGLTSLPMGLLSSMTGFANDASFQNMFQGCTSLTTIPNNLFSTITGAAGTHFWLAFKNCSNLKNFKSSDSDTDPDTFIPVGFFNSNLSFGSMTSSEGNDYGIFVGCSKLTGLPRTAYAKYVPSTLTSAILGNKDMGSRCPANSVRSSSIASGNSDSTCTCNDGYSTDGTSTGGTETTSVDCSVYGGHVQFLQGSTRLQKKLYNYNASQAQTVSCDAIPTLGTGKYFTGWCDSYSIYAENGTGNCSDGNIVTVAAGSTGTLERFLEWDCSTGYTRNSNVCDPIKTTVTLNTNAGSGTITNAGTTAVYVKYGDAVYNSNSYSSAITTITKPTRTITVTYDANGGSVSTTPANTTATSTFKGYYEGADGSGTQYIGENASIASSLKNIYSGTKTLYAKWTTDGSVTLPIPTKQNYNFAGWKVGNTSTVISSSVTSYTPSAPVTLTAQWTAASCDPGYWIATAGASCTSCPAGYYCTGDGTRQSCGTNSSPNNSSGGATDCNCTTPGYTINGNAGGNTTNVGGSGCQPIKTTVTLNTNAGNNVSTSADANPATLYVTYGSVHKTSYTGTTITSITKPTRKITVAYDTHGGNTTPSSSQIASTFGGYYSTSASSGGTEYIDSSGNIKDALKNLTSGTATIHARWTNGQLASFPASPTKQNYNFDGWYTEETGGTKVTVPYTPTQDVMLHAHWTRTGGCSTTQYLSGGACVDCPSNSTGGDSATTCTCITGYGKNGTTTTTVHYGDTCSLINYTITFYSGTSSVGTETYQYSSSDQTVTHDINTTPGFNGKIFTGWCTSKGSDNNGTGTCTKGSSVTIPAGATGAKTFYAKWENPKFTLTTTNTTTSFSFQIAATGNFYVDCGTGGTFGSTTGRRFGYINPANTDPVTYTCNYSSAGAHVIMLGGLATGYSSGGESSISFASDWNNSSMSSVNAQKIGSISTTSSLGDIFPTLTSSTTGSTVPLFFQTFAGATSLQSIPESLFDNVTGNRNNMFLNTFRGCTSLQSIPAGLFSGISGGASYMFSFTFGGCTSLTTIPMGLFGNLSIASYMFQGVFSGCTGLKTIPKNLFANVTGNVAAGAFVMAFTGCSSSSIGFKSSDSDTTGVSYIPVGFFNANLTNSSSLQNVFYTGTANTGNLTTTGIFGNTSISTSCPAHTYLKYSPSWITASDMSNKAMCDTCSNGTGGNVYTLSDAGSTSVNQCYKNYTCPTPSTCSSITNAATCHYVCSSDKQYYGGSEPTKTLYVDTCSAGYTPNSDHSACVQSTCEAGKYLVSGTGCVSCSNLGRTDVFCPGGTNYEPCPNNSEHTNSWTSCTCITGHSVGGTSTGATTTIRSACQPIKTTITLNANGGTQTGTVPAYVKYNDKVYTSSDAVITSITKPTLNYTVTFNTDNGGSVSSSTTSAAAVFNGYYNSSTQYISSTGAIDTNALKQLYSGSLTLTAQWGAGHVSSLPTPTNAPAGKIFAGWYTTKTSGGEQFTTSTDVTAGRTIYARWNACIDDTYANGTSCTPCPSNSHANTDHSACDCNTGFSVGGTTSGSTTNVTSACTVIPYALVFKYVPDNSSSLTSVTPGSTYTYNASDQTVSSPSVPTKSGKTFSGWCDNKDANNNGTGNCSNGNTVTITGGTTGNKTYYAKWDDCGAGNYVVNNTCTACPSGYYCPGDGETHICTDTYAHSSPNNAQNGCVCDTYYSANGRPNGATANVNCQPIIITVTLNPNSDNNGGITNSGTTTTTLYVHGGHVYSDNALNSEVTSIIRPQRSFTIQYSAPSGATPIPNNRTISSTFDGYSANGGTLYINSSGEILNSLKNVTDNSGAVTLGALWTPGEITLPAGPTYTNSAFSGWYTANDNTGTRAGGGGDSYTPTTSMTLYAKYTTVSCNPGYYLDNGSCVSCPAGKYCDGTSGLANDCAALNAHSSGGTSYCTCNDWYSVNGSPTTTGSICSKNTYTTTFKNGNNVIERFTYTIDDVDPNTYYRTPAVSESGKMFEKWTGCTFGGNAIDGTKFKITDSDHENKTCNAQFVDPDFTIVTNNTNTFSFWIAANINDAGNFYVDCGPNGSFITGSGSDTNNQVKKIVTGDTAHREYKCKYGDSAPRIIHFRGHAWKYSGGTGAGGAAISFGYDGSISDTYTSINARKIVEIDGSLAKLFPVSNVTNGVPTFSTTFLGATNLEYIPSSLFNFTDQASAVQRMFTFTFAGSGLKEIPSGLFNRISGAADFMFDATFSNCKQLTSIPSGLFDGINGSAPFLFADTFSYCEKLESIPDNLFRNVSSGAHNMFNSTFAECSKLKSVPMGLFNGVTSAANNEFDETFYGCTSLQTVPNNLFANITGSVGDSTFRGTFTGCSTLSGFKSSNNDTDPVSYVPIGFFNAGLTNNNAIAPLGSGVSTIFSGTQIATSCPAGLYRNYSPSWITSSDMGGKVMCAPCPSGPQPNGSYVTYTSDAGAENIGQCYQDYSCAGVTPSTAPNITSNALYVDTWHFTDGAVQRWYYGGTEPQCNITVDSCLGDYEVNSNANGCTISCPSGTYIDDQNCTSCPAGKWCDGSATQHNCPANSGSNGGASACECNPGYLANGAATTTETDCTASAYTITFKNGNTVLESSQTYNISNDDDQNFVMLDGNAGGFSLLPNNKILAGWCTNAALTEGCTNGNNVVIGQNTTGDRVFYAKLEDSKFELTTISLPTLDLTNEFPIEIQAIGDFYIDCGVGGAVQLNGLRANRIGYIHSSDLSIHTYRCAYGENTGTHTIKMGGQATGGYDGNSDHTIRFNNADKIASIGENSSLGAIFPTLTNVTLYAKNPSFAATFYGAINLQSIPAALFSNVTGNRDAMFLGTFRNCTSLQAIPPGLFSGISGKAEAMFTQTFENCDSLQSIPSGLFSGISGAETGMFSETFKNSDGLTTIEPGLFDVVTGAAEQMFYGTFSGCSSLASIPSGLFRNVSGGAPEMFVDTFAGCTSLTTIPMGLFGNMTIDSRDRDIFAQMFEGCESLTTIPNNLFANVTGNVGDGAFDNVFYNCTSLSGFKSSDNDAIGVNYIPVGFFNANLTNNDAIQSVFYYNTPETNGSMFGNTQIATACPANMYRHYEPDWIWAEDLDYKVMCSPCPANSISIAGSTNGISDCKYDLWYRNYVDDSNPYSSTHQYDGNPQQCTYNTSVNTYSTPTKPGYRFAGWVIGDDSN